MAMRRPRMRAHRPRAAAGEIDAVEQDRAVEAGQIVRQQPQDRKTGNRLAAAAFADDADALAGRDVEIDLARRLPDALRGLEADAEPAHRHQRLRGAARNRFRPALCRPPLPSARRPLFLFHELFFHQHLGADDAIARELLDLGIRQPEQAAEDFVVMLAERRRRAADRRTAFRFRGTASTAADACR